MKAHAQTIINVALAVAVTLLIYQNNQLQDNVETLKGYAQLDTDKAWDRMDKMEAETTMIKERVGIAPLEKNKFGDTPVYYSANERLSSYGLVIVENQSRLDKNEHNIKQLIKVVDGIEDYLVETTGED